MMSTFRLEPKMQRNWHETQAGSMARLLLGLIIMVEMSTHLLDAASVASQARGLGLPYYAMMEHSKIPQRHISSSRLFGVLPELPVPQDKAAGTLLDAKQASRGTVDNQDARKETAPKSASEVDRAGGKRADSEQDSGDDDIELAVESSGGKIEVAKGSVDEPRIWKGLGLGAGLLG